MSHYARFGQFVQSRRGKRIRIRYFIVAVVATGMASLSAMAESENTLVRRTTLIVADIEKSVAFYSDVLGYSRWYYNESTVSPGSIPSAAKPGDPSIFAIMKGRDPWIGMVGLLQKGHARDVAVDPARYSVEPGDVILMMETNELDAIYARMLEAGTPIWKHPATTTVTGAGGKRWDATFLFAFDPDGHLLEINQPHGKPAAFDGQRRAFSDTRLGQLHYRYTADGEGVPLVLLHQTPLSGRMFQSLIGELANNRQVLAPDTPGYGESDGPLAPPEIGDYTDALIDWLDDLGLARVDLFGYHTGSAIAADLSARYPDRVRRVVLMSVPLFDAAFLDSWHPGPPVLTDDGAYLTTMWESSFSNRDPQQSLEMIAATVAEKQRAGSREWWALGALKNFDLARALAGIRAPVGVVVTGDGLQARTRHAATLLGPLDVVEKPEWGYGIFDTRYEEIADIIEALLEAEQEPEGARNESDE